MKYDVLKRLLAAVLCLCMVLSTVPAPAFAVESEIAPQADTPITQDGILAVVGACSDFQYNSTKYQGTTYADKYAANAAVFTAILNHVKADFPKLDAYLISGDYDHSLINNQTASESGINAAYGVLNSLYGLTHDQIQFVQGNHDPATAAGLDATGAYDYTHFSVYQINEDDFQWNDSDANVKETAADLKTYLDARVAANDTRPIFVISHLPLHHNYRLDNTNARYLVDVMNEAGARGLNIIYLFGHNHSGSYDKYLGLDRMYFAPGQSILVSDPDLDALEAYDSVELNFTYMNPGYLGYTPSGYTLSSSMFAIYEDRVEIRRYNADGLCALKNVGASSDSDGNWAPDTTEVPSPQTLNLSRIALSVTQNTMGKQLALGQTGVISIGVNSSVDYDVAWSASKAGVVSITPNEDNPGTAVIEGIGAGNVVIQVKVTPKLVTAADDAVASTVPATMQFSVTVAPEGAVSVTGGSSALAYKLVTDWSAIEAGNTYMILNANQTGTAFAMGGTNTSTTDPATQISQPLVMPLPGYDGLFTFSAGNDQWYLRPDGDVFAVQLKQPSGFLAADKTLVPGGTSYDFPGDFRICSSLTSEGSARWIIDGQELVMSTYYKGGHQTPDSRYILTYNDTEKYFQLRVDSYSPASPIYFYEQTQIDLQNLFVWVEGDGEVEVGASGDTDTGAKLCCMLDGNILKMPVTVSMLDGAYPMLPSTQTCTLKLGDVTITDSFTLRVLSENGETIEAVELVRNNGNIYTLNMDEMTKNTAFVTVDRKTAGMGYAVVEQVKDGVYTLTRQPAEVFTVEGQGDTLFVQAGSDSWVFHTDSSFHVTTHVGGKYLSVFTDSTDISLTDETTSTWRMNTTYGSFCSIQTPSRVIEWDGEKPVAKLRSGGYIGTYVYAPDDRLDAVFAYAGDASGFITAGKDGALESGEVITIQTYLKNGTVTTTTVPIDTSMLRITPVELNTPGKYPCQLVYRGKVICENFQLEVLSPDGAPISEPVILLENKGNIFTYVTTMQLGKKYVFVNGNAVGTAPMLTYTGEDGFVAENVQIQTLPGSEGVHVIVDNPDAVWESQSRPGGGENINADLYNAHHDGYMYIDNTSGYQLLFTQDPTDSSHGWRVCGDKYLITNDLDVELYATVMPLNGKFVANNRGDVSTRFLTYAFQQDDSLNYVLGYADSLTGTAQAGVDSVTAVGGNVVIKYYNNDGTVTSETVPITMGMLDLTLIQRNTPGTYTCELSYEGKVISDDYTVTITSVSGGAADDPVMILENKGQIYKQVPVMQEHGQYAFVNSNKAGTHSVLSMTSDQDLNPEDIQVFSFDDATHYVEVTKDNWIWNSSLRPNGGTEVNAHLCNKYYDTYLYIDADTRKLSLTKDPSVIRHGWRASSGQFLSTNNTEKIDGVVVNLYSALVYDGTQFLAHDRNTNFAGRDVIYAYEQDFNLEGIVAYVDTLSGRTTTDADGSTATGGNLVVKTYCQDGTTGTAVLPITASLLDLTTTELNTVGQHTCSVVYNGKVITDEYVLTVEAGTYTPADAIIPVFDTFERTFCKTYTGLQRNKRHVFVCTDPDGKSYLLALNPESDGQWSIHAAETEIYTIDGIDGTYVSVPDETPIFCAVKSLETSDGTFVPATLFFLSHTVSDGYLYVDQDYNLMLADPDTAALNTYGWRCSSNGHTLSAGSADVTDFPYATLIHDGDTFITRNRNLNSATSNTVDVFVEEANLRSILAFTDGVEGTLAAGQTGVLQPGGNVIIKTYYKDGTASTKVIPITADMLSATPMELNTPDTYTCTLTYDGTVLSENYILTVTGEANPLLQPVNENVVAWLDGTESDNVPAGIGGSVATGDYLHVYTYKNGVCTLEHVPVTVGMLNISGSDLNTPDTYENLTLTYRDTVFTTDYTLHLVKQKVDNYPDFPNEGSVRVDKHLDTGKYPFLDTGTARINLSVTGIPNTGKANVVIILDASSSMLGCTHAVDPHDNHKLTDMQRLAIEKAAGLHGTPTFTAEESTYLKSLGFSGYGNASLRETICGIIEKLVSGTTITDKERDTLRQGFSVYGFCWHSDLWVGDDAEGVCRTRVAILKDALANLLDFLGQDINGRESDIDVAVAYFNVYYPIDSSYHLLNTTEASIRKVQTRTDDELMLPFTSSKDINIPEVISRYKTISGTNFDRGMEWAYKLLSEKQTQDYQDYLAGAQTEPYEPRQDFVLFMTDGEPYQVNYVTSGGYGWSGFLSGTLNADLSRYVEADFADTFAELYNPNGKMWLAEAIKGSETEKYKIIDPAVSAEKHHVSSVNGLGATMMTVKFADGDDSMMKRIATDDSHYFAAHSSDEINKAFTRFGTLVRSANGAVFKDQLGDNFDLQMSTIITKNGEESMLEAAPNMDLTLYELYKYAELGHPAQYDDGTPILDANGDPITVTSDMVGKRKPAMEGKNPVVIESITFNVNGTEAYSSLIVDSTTGTHPNILTDGIICGKYFWYNTSPTTTARVDVDDIGEVHVDIAPESFYWNVGSIQENELVLSYDIYLSGTMEGTRPGGSYLTNNYATLDYVNHLGNKCQLTTTSPVLPWDQATVGYAFYLVNSEGKPIIRESDGLTGSFEHSIKLTQPVYLDIFMNSETNMAAHTLTASDLLPAGYTLYEPTAQYYLQLDSNGAGKWQVLTQGVGKNTTYVAESGAYINVPSYKETEEGSFATASTVVWFAVRADVNAVPDTIVVDYGLPVDIHVLENDLLMLDGTASVAGIGEIRPDPGAGVVDYSQSLPTDGEGNALFTDAYTGTYGSAALTNNGSAHVSAATIRYTLTRMLSDCDRFSYAVRYTGDKGTQGYYYSTVTVIPATTVYYEDNFGTISYATYQYTGSETASLIENGWSTVGTVISGATQDEDRAGTFSLEQIDANNLYGTDSRYKNMTLYSLGSAKKFTAKQEGNTKTYGTVEFTFKGTGFDVISMTSATTGTITVQVTGLDEASGYTTKSLLVDTYYGYEYADPDGDGIKNWIPSDGVNFGGDKLYQVPVIKVDSLPYGQYKAVITVSYSEFFDHGQYGNQSYDFILDAIRIYDPAADKLTGADTTIRDAYVADSEGWPKYAELRNLIITAQQFDSLGGGEVSGIVFIDNVANTVDTRVSVTDYTNYGPNNELYLAPGQAIAFDLNMDDDKTVSVQLALKSVGGTAKVVCCNAADTAGNSVIPTTISTATDLYYDITALNGKTVIIRNTGTEADAILSVTNLKVTHTADPGSAKITKGITVSKNSAALALAWINENNGEEDPTVSGTNDRITLQGATLSFEDEIYVNLYCTVDDPFAEIKDIGLLMWSSQPEIGDYFSAESRFADGKFDVQSGRFMVRTHGIPAKKLGDVMYLRIYAELTDGGYAYSDLITYSPKQYAMSRLEKSDSAELKALCAAMLNYGAAAQKYFGYKVDSLMNADLTPQQQALVAEYSADLFRGAVPADGEKTVNFPYTATGFRSRNASVSFEGAFAINYYFTPNEAVNGQVTFCYWTRSDYLAADMLTLENATGTLAATANANGVYWAQLRGIAAKKLDDTYYAAAFYTDTDGRTHCTGVIAYSLSRYCMNNANSAMGQLAQATAVYGYHAKSYFGA